MKLSPTQHDLLITLAAGAQLRRSGWGERWYIVTGKGHGTVHKRTARKLALEGLVEQGEKHGKDVPGIPAPHNWNLTDAAHKYLDQL